MSTMGTYYEEMKEENNWDEADKHYESEQAKKNYWKEVAIKSRILGLERITNLSAQNLAELEEEMADYRKQTARDFEKEEANWKEEKNIIRKYLSARIIEVKKEPWEYWCDQELDFLETELDHLNEECTICKRYSGGK